MSENKVIALFDYILCRQDAVHPEIIESLEKFLAQSKRGEINGIAIAISRPNDTVNAYYHFGSSSFCLFGAVAHLQNDLMLSLQRRTINVEE